jgi:hypothetical protein
MKEPTGKTWIKTFVLTEITSEAIGYFIGTPLTVREVLKTVEYSAAFATITWLFALARWNRAILKG